MFIVGGHDHEPEHVPGTATTAEIMKGASNARGIWQIDLVFDNDGTPQIKTSMIALDQNIAEDPEYLKIADKWRNRLLEAGYRGASPGKGYFPQVSGFRVCIDRSQPAGSRIAQLQVPAADGWAEIVADKDYTVVAPDFLLRGGDGYRFPKERERSRPASELKYLVLDAVIRAQSAGEKVGKAVDPDNPRIAYLAAGKTSCFE